MMDNACACLPARALVVFKTVGPSEKGNIGNIFKKPTEEADHMGLYDIIIKVTFE